MSKKGIYQKHVDWLIGLKEEWDSQILAATETRAFYGMRQQEVIHSFFWVTLFTLNHLHPFNSI